MSVRVPVRLFIVSTMLVAATFGIGVARVWALLYGLSWWAVVIGSVIAACASFALCIMCAMFLESKDKGGEVHK